MPWTEEVRTFFVSLDQYLFCAGEYDTCRLLDSKCALQCLLGSVSSSLLRTQIRLAFYSCKWGAFYSCNRGAFYSCNCRNDFLLTYNDKLYLTFGVKNERRHELVLAVLWYEEAESIIAKRYNISAVLLVINRWQKAQATSVSTEGIYKCHRHYFSLFKVFVWFWSNLRFTKLDTHHTGKKALVWFQSNLRFLKSDIRYSRKKATICNPIYDTLPWNKQKAVQACPFPFTLE